MLRSPEHARGTTPAKRQSGHEMQISSKDFTFDVVCTMLPLCIKVPRLRAPRDELGDCPFCYLYDKNYAFEYATLCYAAWHRARLVGPGTRRLALWNASCSRTSSAWRLSCLLSEAAARRTTDWWTGVRKNGRPHEKWLRTQSISIA